MYLESCDYSSEYEYCLRMCAVNRLKFLCCIKNYAFFWIISLIIMGGLKTINFRNRKRGGEEDHEL